MQGAEERWNFSGLWSWGDGSIGKVIVLQAGGLECDLQHPHKIRVGRWGQAGHWLPLLLSYLESANSEKLCFTHMGGWHLLSDSWL